MSYGRPALVFVDRLTERMQFDRWGFLVFAIAGSAFIIFAKIIAAPAGWVAAFAVAVMLGYALVVSRSEMGRLRSDQAGDNCYYLGLIFTLTSLAYAIFTFDPDDTATTIIQGFGIALATTILGLVLRVFFNQTRGDIVDIEDKSRLELAEAAGQLKAVLAQVTVSMNEFSRQTRQSLDEARTGLVALVEGAVEEGTRGIEGLSRKAIEALGSEYEALGTRTRRVNAALDRVGAAFEGQADGLETFAATTRHVIGAVDGLGKASTGTNEALTAITQQATELASIQASVKGEAEAVEGVVRRISEIEAASKTAMASMTQTLADAEARLRTAAEGVGAIHQATVTDLADQLLAATRAIHAHNQALEGELQTSRTNVGKVHASLVEMTGVLADKVERLTSA